MHPLYALVSLKWDSESILFKKKRAHARAPRGPNADYPGLDLCGLAGPARKRACALFFFTRILSESDFF